MPYSQSLTFIQNLFLKLYDLFFNQFSLPDYPNVYFGWIIISCLCMGITLRTILNLPKSIPNLKRSKKDNG